jgi:hypothetical protein
MDAAAAIILQQRSLGKNSQAGQEAAIWWTGSDRCRSGGSFKQESATEDRKYEGIG